MEDFEKILMVSREVAERHPGHVFIGGVAVYLHALDSPLVRGAVDASHDADLMLSLTDFSDLRDEGEVTANRRLSKHQLIKDGVELDVYVERNNDLVVSYDEAFRHAEEHGGVKVACLQHLLALKLEAYISRGNSSKGSKDARDIVMIVMMLGKRSPHHIFDRYLRPEGLAALEKIEKSQAFVTIAGGNVHEARKIRSVFSAFVTSFT